MKLLIVLSVIVCGYAAKLDRTYLPPANAGTSGGSPGSLNTPLGPSGFGQPAGFGQARPSAAFNGPAGNSAAGQSNNGFGSPSNQYIQPGQTVGPNYDAGFGTPAQNFGNQAQDYQRSQPQRSQASAEQSAQILRSDSQNDGESFSYSFETSNGISAEQSGVATNGVQSQGAFAYSSDDGQSFRVQYTADENGYQPQGDHLPTSPPIPEEILKSIEENARAAASGTQEGAYNPDEDNEVSQQYSNNAPTSYNQAPTGNQAASAQLYGAPNAGARPQSQVFSQGPQATQYNAGSQNGESSGPSSGFSRTQSQSSSQLYGSSSSAGNGANSFEQQRPSKYSAGPSANFGPSGPQTRPQQYQASSSSQFQSGGRPQGSAQAQDASGYQYNKPQGGSGNANTLQQYRPQNGATFGLQGFSKSNGNSFPSLGSNGQGSFGASPNSQGSYGSAPSSQGSFTSVSKGPSSFGSNSQTSYSARPSSAGPSFGGQSFGPSSNGFNRPQAGSNGFRPQGQAAGATSMSGYEYNKPGGSQFGGSPQISGSSQAGGSQFGGSPQIRGSSQAGGSQFGGSPQIRGSSQAGGSQFGGPSQFGGSPPFNAQNDNAQSGIAQNGLSQGQAQFGAPRSPPSFSEEEGYKY